MSPGDGTLEIALVGRAQDATPEQIATYEPNEPAKRLAATLAFERPEDAKQLYDKAGVSKSEFYRILKNPAAVHYITAHGTRVAESGLAAVHTRLLHKALTSNSAEWTKLFLARFDPEFSRKEALSKGRNTQTNVYVGMSDEELQKFIERETRKAGLLGGRRNSDRTDARVPGSRDEQGSVEAAR